MQTKTHNVSTATPARQGLAPCAAGAFVRQAVRPVMGDALN